MIGYLGAAKLLDEFSHFSRRGAQFKSIVLKRHGFMLPLCKIRVEYEMHFTAGYVYASGGSKYGILKTMCRHTQRQDLPNAQLLAKRVLATRASGYQCEDVEPTCPRNLGTPAVMFDVCIASNS